MFKKMMSLTIIALVLSVISPAAHSAEISIPITGPDGHLYDGILYLPNTTTPVPIVVVIPGTDGVDQRQDFYRPRLLSQGIGTFTLDIKSGVFTSRRDRPPVEHFLPVVVETLRALRKRPEVDGNRIAIMGWSFGGAVALRLVRVNIPMSCSSRESMPLRPMRESTEAAPVGTTCYWMFPY